MSERLSPLKVMPKAVAKALGETPFWFVIGGQAVRCICPYRPSRDVDFGVLTAKDAKSLLDRLRMKGNVEIFEQGKNEAHFSFEGVDVSIFVLPELQAYVEDHALNITGILATKVHAILDRGTRRDFFDLYVMLAVHRLGLLEALNALSTVYEQDINQGLFLRALTYFEEADAEATLPNEGPADWDTVKHFFRLAVAALLVPPVRELSIAKRVVGVEPRKAPAAARRKPLAKRSPVRR